MIRINYKELVFYKKSHQLTLDIYKTTRDWDKSEKFGLISQVRRASSSICANISEGSGRSTTKEYKNFLHYALGSAKEVEYHLLLAKDLDYISINTYDRLTFMLDEVIGSLTNYIKRIRENE